MRQQRNLTAVLIAMSSFGVGCDAIHNDVSESASYKRFINADCSVKYPLNAFGVTKKIKRNKEAEFVALTDLRLSGPEITFSAILETGTKLQVISVRQCTNCLFETRVEYQVKVAPEPREFQAAPVFLDAQPLSSGQIVCNLAQNAA